MTLKVQSIDDLEQSLVEAAQAELSQLIQERHPEVELTRGVIHDIIAFFAGGVSGAVNQTEINRVLNSRSLLAITQDPELADDELVDHVLSNYMVTRKTGTRASGDITIVVTGDSTVVIPANALYRADGLDFRVDVPITARPSGTTTTNPNDCVLLARTDGYYEFSVPATAVVIGETGNIRAGTKFTPEPVPSRFITAYGASDFTGGTAEETNTELIQRMQTGIAAPVMSGRNNIVALIRSQAVFADSYNFSIVGFGDAEMSRDQHWIFPVSGGGRIDIYAQMAALPQSLTVRKQAVLVEIDSTSSIWQVGIGRDDAPGFYDVLTVRRDEDPLDVGGFAITAETRSYDLSADTWLPDIQNNTEAAYTRYQSSVIQFEDTLTPVAELTIGETRYYNLTILVQPNIRELQDFLASSDVRPLTSDVLVKSAVPCFLSLDFNIYKNSNESAPDTDAIRTAVAGYVNKLGFAGTLYASSIHNIIHDYLTGSTAVGQIMLHGKIRRVDGSIAIIRDTHALQIPNSPSTLVTPKTVAFMLDPQDVGISVINRDDSP